jgi:hypothetical protein
LPAPNGGGGVEISGSSIPCPLEQLGLFNCDTLVCTVIPAIGWLTVGVVCWKFFSDLNTSPAIPNLPAENSIVGNHADTIKTTLQLHEQLSNEPQRGLQVVDGVLQVSRDAENFFLLWEGELLVYDAGVWHSLGVLQLPMSAREPAIASAADFFLDHWFTYVEWWVVSIPFIL